MDDFTENLLKDLSEQTNRSLRQTKELLIKNMLIMFYLWDMGVVISKLNY